MATSEELSDYRGKRRFGATPEPAGDRPRPQAADGTRPRPDAAPRFVVHEHHARRLHWDLRLERDGVLASWAVPNGIPDDPRNRKAIHVEDHPLDYIDFHGEIPAGNYGAGEVSIWDHGTYQCEKWRRDEVIVVFAGERLKGRYALFQAGRKPRDWMIHRMDPPVDADAEEMPGFVPPMLAKLSTLPADESQWAFEVKWDGVRAIAHSEPGRLHLLSRNGNDVSAAYPELRALNGALGSRRAILDGELVAFDADGRPSFQLLQNRMHVRGEAAVRRLSLETPVTYMIFDLLWLDGHSLMGLPYTERRARLDALGLRAARWQVPESFVGEGSALLAATRERGLEGVIGKRLDSRYASGRHSAWTKIKNWGRQEAVIGGWRGGQGGRAGRIGALLLGMYDAGGELRYVGRVGTGFDARELERLAALLAPLARTTTPFAGRQPSKDSHFAEPELVCEVEFSEWTHAGTLRQPSYKGLREDRRPEDVVRERVASSPGGGPAGPPPARDSPADERPASASAVDVRAWLAAGRAVRGGVEVEIEGRRLKLTNADKVLYPATGFTKADLIAYYAGVAPTLLPHLRDRPLTLKRYPGGVDAAYFYEKRSPPHRPAWVQTAAVAGERGTRQILYTLCQDLPTLVWLANLADIELHPSLALAEAVERPTMVAFDLDPGAPAGIVECCQVALQLRELFGQLGLEACAKTSGSKGLQVYLPLNAPDATYERTKAFAHAVAGLLEQRHPQLVVSRMAKAARSGRVLIDWSQNDAHKTTVCVYSLRATETPRVSTPVGWDEVADCLRQRRGELLSFGPEDVLSRIAGSVDLFGKILTLQQDLPALED
ncbi:MAG: DNA ligase D [Acidobacteriota bacterium]|nr:DNA ligase D [Acidobacteriota bacterium]